MRRRTHGVTIIELLIIGVITLLAGAGIFTLVTRAWANHDALLTQNMVQRQARAALDLACDGIRNTSPWNTQGVIAFSHPTNSFVGQYVDGISWTIFRHQSTNQLRRTSDTGITTVISNIKEFEVTFEVRASGNGALVWQQISNMNNNPTNSTVDPRINQVATVYVRVTAQAADSRGILYTSTLQSAVKVRNQFYDIAPPLG